MPRLRYEHDASTIQGWKQRRKQWWKQWKQRRKQWRSRCDYTPQTVQQKPRRQLCSGRHSGRLELSHTSPNSGSWRACCRCASMLRASRSCFHAAASGKYPRQPGGYARRINPGPELPTRVAQCRAIGVGAEAVGTTRDWDTWQQKSITSVLLVPATPPIGSDSPGRDFSALLGRRGRRGQPVSQQHASAARVRQARACARVHTARDKARAANTLT